MPRRSSRRPQGRQTAGFRRRRRCPLSRPRPPCRSTRLRQVPHHYSCHPSRWCHPSHWCRPSHWHPLHRRQQPHRHCHQRPHRRRHRQQRPHSHRKRSRATRSQDPTPPRGSYWTTIDPRPAVASWVLAARSCRAGGRAPGCFVVSWSSGRVAARVASVSVSLPLGQFERSTCHQGICTRYR